MIKCVTYIQNERLTKLKGLNRSNLGIMSDVNRGNLSLRVTSLQQSVQFRRIILQFVVDHISKLLKHFNLNKTIIHSTIKEKNTYRCAKQHKQLVILD